MKIRGKGYIERLEIHPPRVRVDTGECDEVVGTLELSLPISDEEITKRLFEEWTKMSLVADIVVQTQEES